MIQLAFATDIVVQRSSGNPILLNYDEIESIQFVGDNSIFIQLLPAPMCLSWVAGNNPEYLELTLYCILKGPEGNPLTDVTVMFSGQLGEPSDGDYSAVPDENGRIELNWKIYKYECPEPTPAGPGVNTSQITAEIVGEDASITETIVFYRYVQ